MTVIKRGDLSGDLMNKNELRKYIEETYLVEEEKPWIKYPLYEVFRRKDNKKWFAVIMSIPKSKLGICQDGNIDIVNLKCYPDLIGELRMENGFYPAYHMNKDLWISVSVDGNVNDDKIKWLVDVSFELTGASKNKKK